MPEHPLLVHRELHLDPDERQTVVALFEQAGAESDWYYPPRERLAKLGGLEAWLWLNSPVHQWTARLLGEQCSVEHGEIVGYVEVQDIEERLRSHPFTGAEEDYWSETCSQVSDLLHRTPQPSEFCVIERLIVASSHRRQGVGAQLLRQSVNFARSRGKIPFLVVLEGLTGPRLFYSKHGGVEVGLGRGFGNVSVVRIVFP